MSTIVQIISSVISQRNRKEAPHDLYTMQQVQGVITDGKEQRVFNDSFFFFPDRATGVIKPPHSLEPGKKYAVEFELTTDMKAKLSPRIAAFVPV